MKKEELPDRSDCRFYPLCLDAAAAANSPGLPCLNCSRYWPAPVKWCIDIGQLVACARLVMAVTAPEKYRVFLQEMKRLTELEKDKEGATA